MTLRATACSLVFASSLPVVGSVACTSSDAEPAKEEGHQTGLEIEEADPEVLQFGDAGDGSSSFGEAGDGDGVGVGAPMSGDGDFYNAGAGGGADYFSGGAPGAGGSGGAFGLGGEGSMGGASASVGGSLDGGDAELLRHEKSGELEPAAPSLLPPPLGNDAARLTAGIWDDNRSFDFFRIYQAYVHETYPGLMPFSLEHDYLPVRRTYVEAQRPHQRLDISIVLDTTGSMGDEISYLQSEFSSISAEIFNRYPEAEQRWSLVVYRDYGQEEYLTRVTPFMDVVSSFQSALDAAQAGGGGDFEEAPDAGLAEAAALEWRAEEDVAKLVFWVADAPHHASHATGMAAAVNAARDKNIHIYPVGASGLDEFTEFTMRQAAQLTLGRYIFLTDDSGVGGAHREPTLPCYYVTSLRDALLRGVGAEMSGEYKMPEKHTVIREGGSFSAFGVCNYGERSETLAF